MRDVLIGTTDYTVLVKIASTTGQPVPSLVHTDIDIAYSRVETDNDVTTSDVSPATLASLTAAHSDWGFILVSDTDHPGLYRLDIADAVFASGAWEAVVTITDASGTDFYAVDIGFRLVNIDPQASVVPANVTQLAGVTQSLTDLKDFADTGYDPATHKVQGVVLTDTLTTYTGNTPQTGDSFARIGATGSGLTSLASSSQGADATTAASAATSAASSAASAATSAGTAATNTATILARLGAFTGSGVNTVLGFLKAMFSKTATLPSDVGGTADPAADSLEAIRDQGDSAWVTGGGGAGSGAYTLTITVNDGSTALQNATVRMTEGVNSLTATTNASGVATFSLDAATYAVAITKDGYQFTPTTKVVSATGSQTYSMTAVTISASEPDKTTGYLYTHVAGVRTNGVTIYLASRKPTGSGIAFDSDVRSYVSGAGGTTGLVQFTNLIAGGKYMARRGTSGEWVEFTVDDPADDTFEMPSVLGGE